MVHSVKCHSVKNDNVIMTATRTRTRVYANTVL